MKFPYSLTALVFSLLLALVASAFLIYYSKVEYVLPTFGLYPDTPPARHVKELWHEGHMRALEIDSHTYYAGDFSYYGTTSLTHSESCPCKTATPTTTPTPTP